MLFWRWFHTNPAAQVWATWLFYAVLIDLADAVADELSLPFDRISLEMIFRGLYHFTGIIDLKAYYRGFRYVRNVG